MTLSSFNIILLVWSGIAVITFVLLVTKNIRAPYGRHSNAQWGPVMDNKWGWFLMELPALIVMPVLALNGSQEPNTYVWLLVSLWILHYANRVIVFPFRLKTKGKKIPVLIVVSAFFFNMINGFINGYFLGTFSQRILDVTATHFVIGIFVFFIGMMINHKADTTLINLRKTSQGYQIPQGGLFKWVSCPNHFGEIIEWIGFAIVAWNLPALSFAVWTFCNLVPRTLNHHAWYKENFPDYPENRKAVIPGLL